MSLVAVGINHNTAPVAIREKVSFSPQVMSESLLAIQSLPGINEVVILSTCNRSELYCDVEDFDTAVETLTQWLAERHRVEHAQLVSCLYVQPEREAITHISKVACGLDSMVLVSPRYSGNLSLRML